MRSQVLEVACQHECVELWNDFRAVVLSGGIAHVHRGGTAYVHAGGKARVFNGGCARVHEGGEATVWPGGSAVGPGTISYYEEGER